MQRLQIVVKCPDCVEARVRPQDVTLRHCADDESWSYRFTCQSCLRPTNSPTDERAALDAVAAGAELESWRLPAELLEHGDGPPLTIVDLFELREGLLRPDWFDELSRVGGDDRSA